jgi:quercetin dioxygenase-like cupin family protein
MRRTGIAIVFLLGACAGSAVTAVSDSPHAATNPGEAAVVPLDQAEVRTSPTKQARVTILARGHNAFVAKLEMDPSAKIPLHRDSTEEYVHVLEGSGKMTIDGKPYDITPGSTIYMPANVEVSFENSDAKLVGIQVFAGPEPAKKYEAWMPN